MNIINRFTLRTLLKNKVRTFVTILGIILATAMFVSITSIITSLQNYMLDIVVEQSGEWQGQIYNIDKKSKEEICDKAADISEKSYVEIYENQGKSKDISFSGIDDNFRAMLTVKLKSGHMPKDNSQIIMTNMARSVYFENSKIGDKIKLKVDGKGSLKYQVFLKWSQVMVIHLMICRYLQKAVLYHQNLTRCILNAKMFQKWRGHLRHL